MTHIDVLHFAMLTDAGRGDPGTDSTVNLVINDGVERLNHRFPDTAQSDQERGQANHYRVDVGARDIDSARLSAGSIRVGVLGDDAWAPDVLFLWGSAAFGPDRLPAVVPLAIEMDVDQVLSTADPNAVPSMPLRRVTAGGGSTRIERLLLIAVTGHDADAGWFGADIGDPGPGDHGTDDPIEIQVVANGGIVVQQVIRDTSQDDLDTNEANLYVVPAAVPFTRSALARDGIRLAITGDDVWGPNELYLFGLTGTEGRPQAVVPLVHIEDWRLGGLSTDVREGRPRVVLPLVPVRPGLTPDIDVQPPVLHGRD